MDQHEDSTRRAYWTRAFDAAWHFMFEQVLPYPVQECGEALVHLPDAARGAGVEVLFSQRPHVRGLERLFYLREGQLPGFLGVARAMNRRGWVLRVEDGYRTREIQKWLGRTPQVFDAILRSVMWELGGQVPSAAFMFRRCSTMVASIPKFGTHLSGSAIDISVLHRDDPTQEVDRGAPYLEMSALTPMDSPFVSAQARRNRQEISALMLAHGFVAYPWEFWHYSSGDAYDQVLRRSGRPAVYGAVDRDAATGVVRPMDDVLVPLNSDAEVQSEIEAALQRLARG